MSIENFTSLCLVWMFAVFAAGSCAYLTGYKKGYERGYFVANRRYYQLYRFAKGLVAKLKIRKADDADWWKNP